MFSSWHPNCQSVHFFNKIFIFSCTLTAPHRLILVETHHCKRQERYRNGLNMQPKDKHQTDKTLEEKATGNADPKETYITKTNLSILSLESLLKLFCGIDR